jgi:hypothetical protein
MDTYAFKLLIFFINIVIVFEFFIITYVCFLCFNSIEWHSVIYLKLYNINKN